MGATVGNARSRLFDRIADLGSSFSAADANEDFFKE
jgi:hypothetical protein